MPFRDPRALAYTDAVDAHTPLLSGPLGTPYFFVPSMMPAMMPAMVDHAQQGDFNPNFEHNHLAHAIVLVMSLRLT